MGPEHPTVTTDPNNLAELLQATNRLGLAEPLMRRVLARRSCWHVYGSFDLGIGGFYSLE
jgi:hypothetical protein